MLPKPKAIIFDMDGVLINSEYWWQLWEKKFMLQELGEWGSQQQSKIIGRSLLDIYTILQKEYRIKSTWRQFKASYNQAAKQIYQHQCSLMSGVPQILKQIQQQGIRIALASSSFHAWIKMVVERFKLQSYFTVIVSAQNVGSHGKPAPDIYLYTAQQLKTIPTECLVIEDSSNGILSAKTAGMSVVGYQTAFNKSHDLTKADMVVTDLKILLNLF